jgi:hypothetical protein
MAKEKCELTEDWKAVKGTSPREPRTLKTKPVTDLHEDWAVLKGSKYPPYAYLVVWERPDTIAIFKMAILGKSKTKYGVAYKARKSRTLYVTPGAEKDRDYQAHYPSYTRHDLCFTREEVEKRISELRQNHVYQAGYEIRRLVTVIEAAQQQLAWYGGTMKDIANDPVPYETLRKIPNRASKRLVETEPASATVTEPCSPAS